MNELFQTRHVGLSQTDIEKMLKELKLNSLDELISQTIPEDILLKEELELPNPMTERQFLNHIHALGAKNKLFTSYIGRGWYDTTMPAVIQRNIYENPSWY
ncbi:MAG TPA: glycine dehydrogenase (aminomethyl-transferring), partial [Paludibacter sp.]|nr:glycine dehydrogenase (aminomethyl-transferring) [Paludibacter sp.]